MNKSVHQDGHDRSLQPDLATLGDVVFVALRDIDGDEDCEVAPLKPTKAVVGQRCGLHHGRFVGRQNASGGLLGHFAIPHQSGDDRGRVRRRTACPSEIAAECRIGVSGGEADDHGASSS
jgi:hypothetical protein